MGEAEGFRRALNGGDFKRHMWFFYGGLAGFVAGFLLLTDGAALLRVG